MIHKLSQLNMQLQIIASHKIDELKWDQCLPVKDGSDHAVDALRYLAVGLDAAYRTERDWYARI